MLIRGDEQFMPQFHRRRDFALVDPFRMGFKQRKVFFRHGDRFTLQDPPFNEIQMLDQLLVEILHFHERALLHQRQGLGPQLTQTGKDFLLQRIRFLQIGRDGCF